MTVFLSSFSLSLSFIFSCHDNGKRKVVKKSCMQKIKKLAWNNRSYICDKRVWFLVLSHENKMSERIEWGNLVKWIFNNIMTSSPCFPLLCLLSYAQTHTQFCLSNKYCYCRMTMILQWGKVSKRGWKKLNELVT